MGNQRRIIYQPPHHQGGGGETRLRVKNLRNFTRLRTNNVTLKDRLFEYSKCMEFLDTFRTHLSHFLDCSESQENSSTIVAAS